MLTMRKYLYSLIVFILLTTSIHCESFFQEEDKQLHMQVTAAISLVSSNVAYEMGYTETESFWIGFIVAMSVGAGKELYDSKDGGSGFDLEDIGADAIGSSVGAIPVFIIHSW